MEEANGAGYAQELHPVSQPQPAPFAEVRQMGGGHASTRLWLATKRDMHQPACKGCAVWCQQGVAVRELKGHIAVMRREAPCRWTFMPHYMV